jgi:HAD superfamily hydrolase (TIGR01549 family)
MPEPCAGIIFDMDGTLTVPTLDFAAMRREIGAGPGDLVTHISALPPVERDRAWAVIDRHEEQAITDMRLQDGAAGLLHRCRKGNLKLGLVTRNAQRSVDALCKLCGITFDAVVTREFPFLKPHPEPVLHIARQWAMPPREILMVGDYLYDIQSGRAAGTQTCFFRNAGMRDFSAEADCTVDSMSELGRILGMDTA